MVLKPDAMKKSLSGVRSEHANQEEDGNRGEDPELRDAFP